MTLKDQYVRTKNPKQEDKGCDIIVDKNNKDEFFSFKRGRGRATKK